jgi:hypothetical protein
MWPLGVICVIFGFPSRRQGSKQNMLWETLTSIPRKHVFMAFLRRITCQNKLCNSPRRTSFRDNCDAHISVPTGTTCGVHFLYSQMLKFVHLNFRRYEIIMLIFTLLYLHRFEIWIYFRFVYFQSICTAGEFSLDRVYSFYSAKDQFYWHLVQASCLSVFTYR